MKTLCVTGSREYYDWKLVFDSIHDFWINEGYGELVLKYGDCPTGADNYADMFGYSHRVTHISYKADWNTHGRAAGPIRNHFMIDSGVDKVIAFPTDSSRGTLDCCSYAHRKGIPVKFPEMELENAPRYSWWDWAEIISS